MKKILLKIFQTGEIKNLSLIEGEAKCNQQLPMKMQPVVAWGKRHV
jgi:hypothetical protein